MEHIILWRRIKSDDREAFDALYLAYVDLLYNYGLKLCSKSQLVEDSIQDLFINLWTNRKRISIDKAVKNYLLLSLRRLIINKMKANKLVLLENPILEEEDYETPIEEKEVDPNLKLAVNTLPRRQKEVIYLRYFENMDYEEIAGIMSIEMHSVYKLSSKAIKNLRENFFLKKK